MNGHGFWMVWSPEGRSPTVAHPYRSDADQEARRLAEENPGRHFFVLQSVEGYKAKHPKVKSIGPDFPETGVPF